MMTAGNGLRDRACVVGIGRSAYAKRGGLAHEGTLRLALQAIARRVRGTRASTPRTSTASRPTPTTTPPPPPSRWRSARRRVRYAGMVWGGRGAGMGGAFANAAMAVATGVAETVVVLRSISQGELRFGQSLAGRGPTRLPAPFGYALPFGLMSPAQMFALPARRHMHVYGTTIDHFAEVAVSGRRNATTNPTRCSATSSPSTIITARA